MKHKLKRKQKNFLHHSPYDVKIIILLSFVLFILAIPVSAIVANQKSSAVSPTVASTTLSFSQSSIQANPGAIVTTDVVMNPGQNHISFVNLVINYDSTVVNPTSDGIVANNIAFPVVLDGPTYNTCTGSQCSMSVQLSIGNNPTKAISQQTTIATVKFQAVANGSSQLTFNNTQVLSTGAADNPSENVLSASTPATVTVGSGGTPMPSGGTSPTNTPVPSGSCTCPTPPAKCVTPPPGNGTKKKLKCGKAILELIKKDSDHDIDKANKECDIPPVDKKHITDWLLKYLGDLLKLLENLLNNLPKGKVSVLPANATTTLSFNNIPQTVNTGDIITMRVDMTPGSNRVAFTDLFISYDPTQVQPTSDGLVPNTTAFSAILDGPNYNTCNGNQCTMDISLSIGNDPTKAISQQTTIATVKFQAVGPGSAQIGFDAKTQVLSIAPADGSSENVFSGGTAASMTINGSSILTPSPTGGTTITDTPVPTNGIQPTNTPTPTMGGTCMCQQAAVPTCAVTAKPTKKPGEDDNDDNSNKQSSKSAKTKTHTGQPGTGCKGHGAEMIAISPGTSPIIDNCR